MRQIICFVAIAHHRLERVLVLILLALEEELEVLPLHAVAATVARRARGSQLRARIGRTTVSEALPHIPAGRIVRTRARIIPADTLHQPAQRRSSTQLGAPSWDGTWRSMPMPVHRKVYRTYVGTRQR